MSFKLQHLEDTVWNHIIELLKNPILIEEEIDRRIQETTEASHIKRKRQDIEKELQRISKSRDKLLEAYRDGDSLTLDDLRTHMKVLDQKKKICDNDLQNMQAQTLLQGHVSALKSSLGHFLNKLNNSHELSIDIRRRVLRSLINEIILSPDQLEIRHCIPMLDKHGLNENGLLRSDEQRLSLGFHI